MRAERLSARPLGLGLALEKPWQGDPLEISWWVRFGECSRRSCLSNKKSFSTRAKTEPSNPV
eukprot:10990201-Heterocapsa_arctica.AAC.1